MKINITKSARRYGYIIWNSSNEGPLKKMLDGKDYVQVKFNGVDLGRKRIDWKYHRISLGYKITIVLPFEHTVYSVDFKNGILGVKTLNGNK